MFIFCFQIRQSLILCICPAGGVRLMCQLKSSEEAQTND